MLRKLLVTVLVLAVLGGLGWLGHKFAYVPLTESHAKDAHSEAVFRYTHEAEPKVTRYAVRLAQEYGALDPYDRGAINARMQNLEQSRGEISLTMKDKDTDGKVLQETIHRIQNKAMRNVEKKTGLNWNFDTGKAEWKAAMEEEAKPFRDLFEMDRILNRLTWNAAGRMFDKSFPNKDYLYTMERLAKDKAEFEDLRPKLDALMQKNNVN